MRSFGHQVLFCLAVVVVLCAFIRSREECVLAFQAGAAARSSPSPVPRAASTPEPLFLEPGKPANFDVAAPGKHSYIFSVGAGQYTSIALDCPLLGIDATLYGPNDVAIDNIIGRPREPIPPIEIASEQSTRYRVEIDARPVQGNGKRCTVLLSAERPASEQEFSLQRARVQIHEAFRLVNKGKVDDALARLQPALALREKLFGHDDASLVLPLYVSGNAYLKKPDYAKAVAFYERALKIQDARNPDAMAAYLILNNLGIVYMTMDQYDRAEQVLLRAIGISDSVYGPGNPSSLNSRVNLANLYDEEGDYVKAQEMFEKALVDAEKVSPGDPGLSVILSNLAGVLSERGDYESAVRISQRAVDVLRDRPNDPRLGLALVTLGDAYRFQNDLDKAEPLYQRSLPIYEKSLGKNDPLVADNLNYLGDIYRERREFVKAEDFYQRSLAIRKKELGETNSVVGESLQNLGALYLAQRDYARAESFFRQALLIREKALGPEHPEVGVTLSSLSTVDIATGRIEDAQTNLARAISISEHNAALNLVAGSERQKLAYLTLSSDELDRVITLETSSAGDCAGLRDLAATTILQRKGRVLDAIAQNLTTLRQGLGSDGVKLIDQFDSVTSHLAHLVLAGAQDTAPADYQKRIASLKQEREQLEGEISRKSAQFRAASQPVTLEAVRAAMPADAALVEFVKYQKVSADSPSGSPNPQSYIAYIIRPSQPVVWKDLGEAVVVERAIDNYRAALRDPARNDIKKIARALDQVILEPLRPLLPASGHLLISPDGQLSLIPFEALLDQQNRFAVEKYSITYLTSGRDLLRMQVPRSSDSAPVVVADPSFGEPRTIQIASRHPVDAKAQRRSVTIGSDISSLYFAPLSGTAEEARSIDALFPNAVVLTGERANVAALKQLAAPSMLHIATHGFFLEDRHPTRGSEAPKGLTERLDLENPLLRSGLAFAGANRNRSGNDDGILTALEAANLNLWGTRLVTLSACDTGIGEVRVREGVFGLRRAFVLAGAETLVMSLWPVSDYVTREMMSNYYRGLKRGLGREDALRQAQLAMLKRKDRNHPFYWASFIQSGEWANLDGKR
jgi:CHAT domain-containing protein/Tfp pilus assembly protein PilF